MPWPLGRLVPFFTIGREERRNVLQALRKPLSGYLGGLHIGGYWVEKLQHDWANEFEVDHAIACNSATSGLLAACLAVGIERGDTVWITSYSMSATAACAVLLGAKVRFLDIEPETFGAQLPKMNGEKPKAIIVTNLFGMAARDLVSIKTICRTENIWLIEDNAQSPYAPAYGLYAGTVGHIGVFSLNVHKHLQAGEGGVIVTRDHALATKCLDAINHGELSPRSQIGLNLRMSEPIAAIACAQLRKGQKIVNRKVELGETLNDAIAGTTIQTGRQSVYYCWTALCPTVAQAMTFAGELIDLGLPARLGYSRNLVDVFGQDDPVPVARDVERRLVLVECCAIEPSSAQVRKMKQLVGEAAGRAMGAAANHERKEASCTSLGLPRS